MKKVFRIIKNDLVCPEAFHPLWYRIEQRHTILFFIHWWGSPEFEPPHRFENDCDAMKCIIEHHPNAIVYDYYSKNKSKDIKNWMPVPSLDAQQEPICEDVEDAAKHYLYSNILYDDVYVGNPTEKDCIEMFEAGANWQKEQMMSKAIDATIEEPEPLLWEVFVELECLFVVENNLHDGDGVKVIIVKEE